MVGVLGVTTYVFTAVFVYMSEKDLEHYVSGTTKESNQGPITCKHAPGYPPILPSIVKASDSSKDGVSFEQFREDGFVEIDLERQVGRRPSSCCSTKALDTKALRVSPNCAVKVPPLCSFLGEAETYVATTLRTMIIILNFQNPTIALPWLRSTVRH